MDLPATARTIWSACAPLLARTAAQSSSGFFVVYADSPFTSAACWSAPGGLASFAGALVRDFPPSATQTPRLATSEPDSVVLLLSNHLSRTAEQIRSLLLAHPYQTCIVISSLSEALHAIEVSADPSLVGVWSSASLTSAGAGQPAASYFDVVETRIREWMTESAQSHGRTFDRDFEISVQHLPLCFSLIAADMFLFPQSAKFFPQVAPKKPSQAPTPSNEPSSQASQPNSRLSEDDKRARELACSLTTFLETLGFKEEIFALGPTSKQVARMVVGQSTSSRRRSSPATTALILVDRTLDLVAPTMHSDNLLDQIWASLPRFTPESIDVSVAPQYVSEHFANAPISVATAPSSATQSWVGGPKLSLSHGLDDDCLDLVTALVRIGQREGLVAARRRLVDLIATELGSEAQVPRMLGRVTLEQLNALVSQVRDKPGIWKRKSRLLQLMSAIIETIKESPRTKWEELLGIEKVVAASLAETMDPTFMVQQIRDLLLRIVQERQQQQSDPSEQQRNSTTSNTITAKNLLMVMLYAYSLLGDSLVIPQQHESALQDGLFRAMVASSSGANQRAIQAWVVRVFAQMRQVAHSRSGLGQFRHLFAPQVQPPYEPLLVQLAYMATQPPQSAMSHAHTHRQGSGGSSEGEDLAHVPHGGTLGSVMSGFTRLLGTVSGSAASLASAAGALQSGSSTPSLYSSTSALSSRPHPFNHDHVIIFVIGGITFAEVGRVRDIFRANGKHVIVGSTDIATTETMMTHIFKSK